MKHYALRSTDHDIALWESFLQGDQDAFGLLFRSVYPHLYQYGSKICRDPALLEDTIQELFLDIWKSRNPTPAISVRAYLLKALKYKLVKEMNRHHTTGLPDNLEAGAFELDHETLLIAKQEDEERASKVGSFLQQLSNRQKEIIYLKFYQNLSYEEVSAIMNINYQAARNLLYQAIRALKKQWASVNGQ